MYIILHWYIERLWLSTCILTYLYHIYVVCFQGHHQGVLFIFFQGQSPPKSIWYISIQRSPFTLSKRKSHLLQYPAPVSSWSWAPSSICWYLLSKVSTGNDLRFLVEFLNLFFSKNSSTFWDLMETWAIV